MSLLKNEADAEDIVQETFLTLIKSYDTIKDKRKVTSWLKKTRTRRKRKRSIKIRSVNKIPDRQRTGRKPVRF